VRVCFDVKYGIVPYIAVRVIVTVTLSLLIYLTCIVIKNGLMGVGDGGKRICIIVFKPSLATKSKHHARIRDSGVGGAGSGLALSIYM